MQNKRSCLFFEKAQGDLGLIEFEKKKEALVEEANLIFVERISVLKGKYEGIEIDFVSPMKVNDGPTPPTVGVEEVNKNREIGSPFTPGEGMVGGVEGRGNSSSLKLVQELQKKKFDVEEWVIELNKIWEEDEEMWSVMDDMFEELKKFLETHGGIKKYDIIGAREAAKILRRKIESSPVREKYGPRSSLGRGLKNQISTGYKLCKWVGDYYDESDDENGK
ncbi:uncharacterized protein LOC116021107 isoform X2 [Ipomoea triloba]|uniref:uncharacterized protein LOC116021107 isoform X1 n=1 Tax=Ipomoea triloba TaxID=35885 RepID=UPI00125D84D5|nr:uncharacterized protein LOC116021107 isoform X1 [Ipomoea triloba]XP_031117577.1 uncharacterized protein LOC116021107 isoform X2 [Ipomoea triloba]